MFVHQRHGIKNAFSVGVEQDQEWIFSLGAGVIFNHSVYEIILSICTLRDL